ncbi:hypothetical protein PISL3812_00662 [Talaromyces islandicus]|uniref:Major facilitator superfamily (MFS) profile domain-containing protein n=1 Tax=Talaromyces islandicus TaxID=28573 RepID=A0A0U1LMG4_TALIS|nr:hypothetical protein PISL3812_00662 [Talaromyces islandicus]
MTAKTWQLFSIGRAFAYLAVGIVENIVPSYQAELAPGEIRGFFAGSIQVFVHIGGIWAAAVTRAYATESRAVGWLVPTAQQLIPAFLLVLLVPFCAESPRWLLEHNKEDHALRSLNKIRPKDDVDNGKTILEIKAIDQANKEARANKVSMGEFLKPTYIERAVITALCFFFNEVTGQQFVNSYGPTFYKSIGLDAMTFTYTILVTLAGLAACIIAILTNDRLGRVPLCMCYTIGAEIGGTLMRKKIMAVGTACDVLSAFLVTFFTPYIQNGPHIQLGARTAFIWMGCSIVAFFFSFLLIPELKGRSLEEVDELFEQRLHAWHFRNATTSGVGARVREIEQGVTETQKPTRDNQEDFDHAIFEYIENLTSRRL